MSDKLWLDEASDISPDEFDAVMRIPQRERKLEAENERLRFTLHTQHNDHLARVGDLHNLLKAIVGAYDDAQAHNERFGSGIWEMTAIDNARKELKENTND